jgi:uncharacterized protein (DUF983 family)
MEQPLPRTKTLLARGLRRRCPHCGQGHLFRHWFKLREQCSVCGLKFLENQGDLWGAILLADRVLFMVPIVVIFFIGMGANSNWPYVLGGLLLATFILTFPHRMALSLALDYRIRLANTDLAEKSKEGKE